MLNKLVKRGFRIRVKPQVPFITELEKEEHNKLQKAFRAKNSEIYWELQGRIENIFIDNFHETERVKKLNDEKKLRGAIVKRAF